MSQDQGDVGHVGCAVAVLDGVEDNGLRPGLGPMSVALIVFEVQPALLRRRTPELKLP